MNSVSVNFGFLKQSHEKIGFIVYATISDFIRAIYGTIMLECYDFISQHTIKIITRKR